MGGGPCNSGLWVTWPSALNFLQGEGLWSQEGQVEATEMLACLSLELPLKGNGEGEDAALWGLREKQSGDGPPRSFQKGNYLCVARSLDHTLSGA